jgi:C-terminal processing protease CtpA/Prc
MPTRIGQLNRITGALARRASPWAPVPLLILAAHGLPGQGRPDSTPDLRPVPAAIQSTFRTHLFDPRVLKDSAAERIARIVDSLARGATSRSQFTADFNRLWRNGPMSHVRLTIARMPADALTDLYDTLRVGSDGVALSWQDDIAVLQVRTMMGLDTRERISAMYSEIIARGARGLIIDLRDNAGGTFATVPLVGHLIERGFDAGVFVGRRWTDKHAVAPDARTIAGLPAWSGWSVKRFWDDVESAGILRIRFEPMAPRYGGPVVVLTNGKTASSAEMGVDALMASGRVTVLGERTAGALLSQRTFDIPAGFQLALPIADYYSRRMGRIEGVGVAPDVVMPADSTLPAALLRLRRLR